MIEPINARLLINNGWTIKNRRVLKSLIGKEECSKFSYAYNKIKEHGNTIPSLSGDYRELVVRPETSKLVNVRESLKFVLDAFLESFNSRFNRPKELSSKEITLDNIKQIVFEYEQRTKTDFPDEIIKKYSISETLNMLYTDKYKPKKRINEDGYPITTIIDRKTGEPVEAFFVKENDVFNKERWTLFTKDGNKNKEIGYRTFKTTFPDRILPGFIESEENNNYRGIGLRLHQLTVERLMQLKKEAIIIDSISEAFSFHYKAGFRMRPAVIHMNKNSFCRYMDDWSEITGLKKEELEQYIVAEYIKDDVYLSNKTEEFFRLLATQRASEKIKNPVEDVTMILEKDNLDIWKELAKSQPILL